MSFLASAIFASSNSVWRCAASFTCTATSAQPAEGRGDPLDYGHYLDKQVRAVAEPVLVLLGMDFDEVIGARKQLSLF